MRATNIKLQTFYDESEHEKNWKYVSEREPTVYITPVHHKEVRIEDIIDKTYSASSGCLTGDAMNASATFPKAMWPVYSLHNTDYPLSFKEQEFENV